MVVLYYLQIRVRPQGNGSFVGWVTIHESKSLANIENRLIFERFNCVEECRIVDQDYRPVTSRGL